MPRAICRERFVAADKVEYVSSGNDLIWSFDVFVHVAPVDEAAYLPEVARVLTPEGVAVTHHADERNLGTSGTATRSHPGKQITARRPRARDSAQRTHIEVKAQQRCAPCKVSCCKVAAVKLMLELQVAVVTAVCRMSLHGSGRLAGTTRRRHLGLYCPSRCFQPPRLHRRVSCALAKVRVLRLAA
jgi:hypothetical protein